MHWGLVKAIVVLPGTVLVFVPVIVLSIAKNSRFSHKFANPEQILFWVALLAAIVGLSLSLWTVALFMKYGKGTPAPWDPPQKLVIRGPYRYVRNPMITAVLFILLSESLVLKSLPIAIWLVVFFVGNAIYFPLVEEKGLEKRFGREYLEYKAQVPRWLPRLHAWSLGSNEQNRRKN
jgi:protein-S-isoprenylcysteine O-methyltransferase Ste14